MKRFARSPELPNSEPIFTVLNNYITICEFVKPQNIVVPSGSVITITCAFLKNGPASGLEILIASRGVHIYAGRTTAH